MTPCKHEFQLDREWDVAPGYSKRIFSCRFCGMKQRWAKDTRTWCHSQRGPTTDSGEFFSHAGDANAGWILED